jgi:hypothetical protein
LVNFSFGELYHANGSGNGYDQLNQVTNFARGTLNSTKDTITSPTHSQSWGFDALGNWTSFTSDSTTQTRTANQQNEITSISGQTTPGYDANGNTTTDQLGHTLIFDAWNRLIQVKNGSTVLETYGYDGLNRRLLKKRPPQKPVEICRMTRYQLTACTRCHAMNDFGGAIGPSPNGQPVLCDSDGFVRPEYLDDYLFGRDCSIFILCVECQILGGNIVAGGIGAGAAAGVRPPGIKPGSSGGVGAGKPFNYNSQVKPIQNEACTYCGAKPNVSAKPTQADHIIARCKGGNNTEANKQPACWHCNASKGSGSAPKSKPPWARGPL